MTQVDNQQNEAKQVFVPLSLPVIIPSSAIVEGAELPEHFEVLTGGEHPYMTKEEAVAFLQWNMVMSQVSGSIPEFLNMYRAVKEEVRQKESGLIVPQGGKIIVPE